MTEIPSRCLRPSIYFALRSAGFAWWHCARIMWHGASLSVAEMP